MPWFACSPVYKASGTYWWWCQTSTLFTVMYKVRSQRRPVLLRTNAGIVSTTGLPAIRIRSPALHHLTINLQCLWPHDTGMLHRRLLSGLTAGGQRLQVRYGARRLQWGRCRPSRRVHCGWTTRQTGQAWIAMPTRLGISIPKSLCHSTCLFARTWLLLIHHSLSDLARSWLRAICAGNLRLYPMFCILVGPKWYTVWRWQNPIVQLQI